MMRSSSILTASLLAVPALALGGPNGPTADPDEELEFQFDLAGIALPEYPYFTNVRAFNEGAPIRIGIDTIRNPRFFCQTIDVYIQPHGAVDQHFQGEGVIGPFALDLLGTGIQGNVFVIDAGTLSGQTGTTDVGVGYDVIVDFNQNGEFDSADVVDGWGDEAGFYVMPDLEEPGPYTTVKLLYNGGRLRRQAIYYPSNVAELGELPLLVVSHGNGHNYRWYDHIGFFMSSWGYVVMSHENNTGPGIEAASTTTLRNTNHFLRNLNTIAGGALRGHVDKNNIAWIGHSRGGEGVVRAYRRLLEGAPIATEYGPENIKLISSIAPTDFLGPEQTNPGDVPYHLWTGGADADVNGCADCNICQTFHLHERATGERYSISLHGAGHGDFHDGGGSSVAAGPCRLGRARTHRIMRGYLLPLLKHVIEGNIPCKDYLWRQYENLRPLGAPRNLCTVVDLMYQEAPDTGKWVLDDFQRRGSRWISSSDGAVTRTVTGMIERRLDDGNNAFTQNSADAMNGMTFAGPGDTSRGVVFQWNGADAFVSFEVVDGANDLTGFKYLSFRAAQATRHALTRAELGDLTFSVQISDHDLRESTINIGAYGGGIEEPYQRTRCGGGAGWANEWETIRIPLSDFCADGAQLELDSIVAVTFLFGPSHGSRLGRIGLDEIEFTVD